MDEIATLKLHTLVVALAAEEEVETTALRVIAEGVAYVLVLDASGQPIGVLAAAAITNHRARRAA